MATMFTRLKTNRKCVGTTSQKNLLWWKTFLQYIRPQKGILNAWKEIKIEELNNLVSSMQDRVYDVIRLNGSKTKYQQPYFI